MSDLLLDFVSYFTVSNKVTGDGIDTFRDMAPELPDSLVVIYEYKGISGIPQVAGVCRSIQIVARAISATVAKEKARELYNALLTETGIINLTEQRWGVLQLSEPPFKIKVDNKSRTYYGFNLSIVTYND